MSRINRRVSNFIVSTSPQLRRRIKQLLPKRASDTIISFVLKWNGGDRQSISLARNAGGGRPSGRRFFNAAWYAKRYEGISTTEDGSFRYYQRFGRLQGHHPSAAYEAGLRIPSRASIPQAHLWRVTSSPIHCRVAPTEYLSWYQGKSQLHKDYGTLEEYLRRATVTPRLIGAGLYENDLRIAAYMDNMKKRLSAKFAEQPQHELISVVLPTRNRVAVLPDAIVSVLMQSYQNWELIIVDDAGEERLVEALIDEFADTRIRYVRLPNRSGNAAARNAGVSASSGTTIAHMDDDDLWDPDHLLVLHGSMREQAARIAYGAQAVWGGYDPEVGLGHDFRSLIFAPFNRSLLENNNYITTISLIHDRELFERVGGFDNSLKRLVDWDLVLRMTEFTTPIAVPCITSHYLQAREAVTVTNSTGAEEALAAVRTRAAQRADTRVPFTSGNRSPEEALSLAREYLSARRERIEGALSPRPVDIIIPNYESFDELEACIGSVASHTHGSFNLHIVDNGSSPPTRERLRSLADRSGASLFFEDEAAGFSHAVNRGLQEVIGTGNDVVILNNDTLVMPGWLDELQYVLQKHPDVAMAVPRQVLPARHETIKVHVPGAFDDYECDTNLSAHHQNILDPYFDVEDGLIELTFAPLFCGLVRASSLADIGRLDAENGAHFRSDWILCDGLRRYLKQRIVYTPHSKIYHMQGVATLQKASAVKVRQDGNR